MTGANYMGGKRNAARARTRDNTGRLQKRHFGQQRLAAALCNTREEREKPRQMTLESALRGIGLAPAQRDPRVTGTGIPTAAQTSTSCDPPSTPSTYKVSFDVSKLRKPPSKILRALDFSDPTSYRDAINRILSIPLSEMIGLPVRGKPPHTQDEGSDDSDNERQSIDDDAESNVQVQETSSDVRFSANTSHLSSLDTNQGGPYHPSSETNLQLPSPDQSMDTNHSLPWSVVDDHQGNFHFLDDSGYADMDTTETRTFRGSILAPDLLGPQRYISPSSNSFRVSFCSSSQGTEECILDMDTSPPSSPGSFVCSIPFDASPTATFQCDISPDHDPLVQQSQFQSASLLRFSAPIDPLELLGCESPIKSSSPQLHVSASAPSAKLEHMSLSLHHPTEISASRDGPFQCPYPAIQTEHAEAYSFLPVGPSFSSFGSSDIQDPRLPLDILNDPDPWATIGKILNIETIKEHDNDDVYFTRGREGVGYIRPHFDETTQKRSSKINSLLSVEGEGKNGLRAMMNDELKMDSVENSDDCHFARYQSQNVEDLQLEERPSLDDSTDSSFVNNTNFAEHHKPHCTLTVVESQMQTGSPSALAHQASPLIVRRGPNEDKMWCEGPCLFVDSGGEDE